MAVFGRPPPREAAHAGPGRLAEPAHGTPTPLESQDAQAEAAGGDGTGGVFPDQPRNPGAAERTGPSAADVYGLRQHVRDQLLPHGVTPDCGDRRRRRHGEDLSPCLRVSAPADDGLLSEEPMRESNASPARLPECWSSERTCARRASPQGG
jgi:hypothetical protein